MKILLLGKNGQVGWELQRSLAPLGDVLALGNERAGNLCGDLTDLDGLAATVRALRPDVIVNAAAYTAVDKAESEPARAHLVNAVAVGVLAEEAQALGAWLVYFSTDYVFDSSGNVPWTETDSAAPLSVYGRTKLEGEQAACFCAKHLIFRTSWVYAARGTNFAKSMLRLAQEREQLNVVSDQFGAPTGAELIADVTAHALRAGMKDDALAGVYHLVAGGETSWFDYARFVIEHARRAGVAIKIAPEAIQPIPSSAYPVPAKRPQNSRLNTQKLQRAFDLVLPHWQHGVDRMLAELGAR